MRSEPEWLPIGLAIYLNASEVELTGEAHFVRDYGLLESACARPQHAFTYGEQDIVALATALLFGIARNHPFEQGNKRTGFLAAKAFLELNGYALHFEDDEIVAWLIVAVLEGRRSEDEFRDYLRRNTEQVCDL